VQRSEHHAITITSTIGSDALMTEEHDRDVA